MAQAIDEPGPVRPGEELHEARLSEYLAAHQVGSGGPLRIQQFLQGHSNLTYLICVGEEELVLRRPPFGNRVKTAHDMGREYRILSCLWRVYEPAPRPFLYCEDEGILGAPFYLMERRKGIILRRVSPSDRALPALTVRRLGESLVDNLAGLHALDYEAAGLADLGKPQGYVERQVTGWTRRYRDAQTHDLPALERVAAWLAGNQPGESGNALIHNDFKFDNLALDPEDMTRIVAVLDWEMATVGDPLLDLGTTLGYWIEPGDPEPLTRNLAGPTTLPGSLTRVDVGKRYGSATGRDVSNLLFYYIYGLFKIAVIAQQIYARYVRGATRDERFAVFAGVIAALGEQAERALDAGSI
jgi:aminoglycoside phosphotransferase (APT) family kinase protein